MTHSPALEFVLRRSLLKISLQVLVLSLLLYCLLQSIAPHWALLLWAVCLWLSWVWRPAMQISHLSHLDQHIWVLADGRQQQQAALLAMQNYGFCVLLTLLPTTSTRPLRLCILIDQLSWPQWCRLQRLARHHPTEYH